MARLFTAKRLEVLIGIAVLAVLALAPLFGDDADLRTLGDFCLYLALAQLWNLLAGYAGLVSVGQQAFVGIGGYTFFALTILAGIAPFPALALCTLAGGAAAAIFAPIVFRLRGPYFAIGTWAVAEACRLSFGQIAALGAGSGVSLPVSVLKLVSARRDTRDLILYELAVAAAAAATLTVYAWLSSRRGLALTAIRDNEAAATSVGVNVTGTKIAAYVVAGLGAALVGGLLFLTRLRITPDAAFSVQEWSAYVIFMVVIGGLGTIEGPIVGVALFLILRGALASLGSWYLMIMGALAILVMLAAPGGLWGVVASRTGWPPVGSSHWKFKR